MLQYSPYTFALSGCQDEARQGLVEGSPRTVKGFYKVSITSLYRSYILAICFFFWFGIDLRRLAPFSQSCSHSRLRAKPSKTSCLPCDKRSIVSKRCLCFSVLQVGLPTPFNDGRRIKIPPDGGISDCLEIIRRPFRGSDNRHSPLRCHHRKWTDPGC